MQICGSGMFIPDPEFYPSQIPDLGYNNKREGGINCCLIFFIAETKTKIEISFLNRL